MFLASPTLTRRHMVKRHTCDGCRGVHGAIDVQKGAHDRSLVDIEVRDSRMPLP
jgi:hypothetical protein